MAPLAPTKFFCVLHSGTRGLQSLTRPLHGEDYVINKKNLDSILLVISLVVNLKYIINMHARFQKIDYFTTLHALIRSCTFCGCLERCRPALLLHPAHFDAFFEGLSFLTIVSKQLQCPLTLHSGINV